MLEGVGYGINQHFEIFDAKEMGTKKVMAVGGGTKNPVWLQAVSDISGKRQYVAEVETGASYGDALIAALATGFYKDCKELAENIRIARAVEPSEEAYKAYALGREVYADLYKNTKEIMHRY